MQQAAPVKAGAVSLSPREGLWCGCASLRVPTDMGVNRLLAPDVMRSITGLKKDILRMKSVSLDLEESLIALGMSAAASPTAGAAMQRLTDLRGCEFHTTHIPTPGDEAGLRRLGVRVTSDPTFASSSLFLG